jgi:hypothetical protein
MINPRADIKKLLVEVGIKTVLEIIAIELENEAEHKQTCRVCGNPIDARKIRKQAEIVRKAAKEMK